MEHNVIGPTWGDWEQYVDEQMGETDYSVWVINKQDYYRSDFVSMGIKPLDDVTVFKPPEPIKWQRTHRKRQPML